MEKIYINVGHSDRDPGAVGYEQERRLNVAVSNYQRDYLLANYDCEVKMNPGTLSDLVTICAEANAWGAKLFVSNHFNAGGGDGWECYVYSEARRPLGAIFEKHVKAAGQNSRGVKVNSKYIVLNSTDMPAILNEGAFVDNKKDIEDWNEDAELKKLGIAYAKACVEFLKLKKKADKPAPVAPAKTNKLVEDGLWGKSTTIRLQQIFGTPVDGLVSNQRECYKNSNPGLVGGWEWETKPNGKGSALIRAMQKWAGMPTREQDGEIGPKTIRAFQKKLGTYQDGKISNPSQMVKALQKWANGQ